ncbi:condensin complex subunit 2-like isoform X2 [Mizuhopecten yessoensis]|nr:condensin complex subunit 2-like isoform X2 [Mizuhopecten yessoensis]XP_021369104.1 condensin complex subunit 2-like isoform X2 [Mizuhopecten yessoensis]
MPEMRDILSPLTTPNIHRTPVFSNIPGISPSTSRSHVGLKSPSGTLLASEHDEAAEKRERRRSRVMQLQQRTLESPVSPVDKRRSLTLNGLSSTQIAEHYANCIKLSAENKITSKNAFGLHLIDYMSDQLKKKELENFQVASTTLDASAKIYAGRVDAIHTETYKVLSGLGRSSDKNKHGDDQEAEDTNADPNEQGTEDENKKKKKKARKKNTVEANIRNIDMKEKDFEAKADALFQIMSATFDEGGISSLLLNSLRCFDDQQGLALDSSTLIGLCPELSECSQHQANDLSEIIDLSRGHDIGPLEMCPNFSTFNWDDANETSILPSGPSSQAFDIDAEPEPIPDMDEDHNDDLPPDMGGLDMEDIGNADSDTSHCEGDEAPGQGISIGDGKAAQLMDTVMKDLSKGSTGTLMQVLAAEPSDYSFFNKTLLRTWAGPEHWKKGPVNRDLSKGKDGTDKTQKKAKKPVFKIDYDQEIDFELQFVPSKSVTLTKATLTKNSKNKKTLPKYLHYETDKLFRLFVKPKLMIKRQNTSSDSMDDVIENYDYENVNDRENFCPRDLEGNHDDEDADSQMGEFDFTAGGSEFSQSQDSQDFGSQPDQMDGTMLIGDKLVAQPHKVTKIDISYAKTAKKLDVKRLKSTMWDIMIQETVKPPVEAEAADKPEVDENTNSSTDLEMKGTCTFQELLDILPDKVSSQTAKNLSVPIAFACLLHLANEKCLKIISLDEDLGNLVISQGL